MAASSSSAAPAPSAARETEVDYGGSADNKSSSSSEGSPVEKRKGSKQGSSLAPAKKEKTQRMASRSFHNKRLTVPWVAATGERLDATDAEHRKTYGDAGKMWTGAMSTYDREALPEDGSTAEFTTIDVGKLEGRSAAAAAELQKVRELSRVDPSFEMTRHTMMILGRPVQATVVLLLSHRASYFCE